MLPDFIIYTIVGLIAFIILGMAFVNIVSKTCSDGNGQDNSLYNTRYDPLSSHARLYSMPAGVKSTS